MSQQPSDHRERLQQALLAIRKLQARVDALELEKHEPIAVTGIGCRFPGGGNGPVAFWRLLSEGRDAITEVPRSRWNIDAVYDPDPDAPGKTYTRSGGFIDQVDAFDPHFFGISPREARSIDPQHRLLLEVAWEALEDAGEAAASLAGSRTGVFVGITASEYAQLLKEAGAEHLDAYHLTGCCPNFVSGRLSHVLGLQGPALAVDTACSSSLVTVHLACQSLRSRECDLALAGGVNTLLTPDTFVTAAKARMLAPDGRCKTFDARANGYVRGEGCGVVVLRRLSDAIARGARILAVVRGSAVNQDGPSSGLTVPNKLAQEALIRQALASARVSPAEVGYVEAHGTGTPLGDPIEVRALGAVLGEGRPASQPFLLGSVKTNIGHLESAAGIAGLIKAVLALVHEAVPPHLHFELPTPHVAWDQIPARVPTRLTPWTRDERPRIAAVSSFGGSGTNAHVVLEEAPRPAAPARLPERPVHVLTLSARTPAALRAAAGGFEAHLATGSDSLPDVCFTANTGRSIFGERLAAVAASTEEMRRALRAYADGAPSPALVEGSAGESSAPRVAFLFSGQGSQYVGMGRALYAAQPVFRAAIDHCDEILRSPLGRSVSALMFGTGDAAADAGLLDRTAFTQPALFAIEWALAELWESWGVRPAAVMGHSVGEYVAACRAGVVSLEEGLALIAQRAKLMDALPAGGAMAAVFAAEPRVAAAVAARSDRLAIAAINGPENTVIAGPEEEVAAVRLQLEAEGIGSRALAVSHAFHSSLLDPMLADLEAAAARCRFSEPTIPIVSNLTGARADGGMLTSAAYWRRHARMPVRFAAGMQALQDLGCSLFVEIGPTPVLLGMGTRCLPEGFGTWLPSLRKGSDDLAGVSRTLATLWAHGVPVDWEAFDRPWPRGRVFAPTYPFERERLWVEPTAAAGAPTRPTSEAATHPLLARRLRTAATSDAVFEADVSAPTLSILDGHRINGVAVLPAAAYAEAMLSAAQRVHGARAQELFDLTIRDACSVPDGVARTLQVVVGPFEEDACICRVFSAEAGDADSDRSWVLHATAAVRTPAAPSARPADDVDAVRVRMTDDFDLRAHYAQLEDAGLHFGGAFRGLLRLSLGRDEAIAEIQPPPETIGDMREALIHPAVLDACFQAVAPLAFGRLPAPGRLYVPVAIERCLIGRVGSGRLRSHAVLRSSVHGESTVLDVNVFDEHGRRVVEVSGLTLRRVRQAALGSPARREWFYRVAWERQTATEIDAGASAWLPDPEELARAVAAAVDLRDPSHGLTAFDERLPELNALATAYMIRALFDLGWRPAVGDVLSASALAEQLGVALPHRRFLARILEMLAEDGALVAAPNGWTVERAIQPGDVRALESRLWQQATCRPELDLMTRVGAQLAPALRGECDVIDLLFPGGSLALAERLYEESPLFRPYNAAIEEAVVAAVGRVPGGRRARLLEIGAGTGATTARLLPRLAAAAADYTFTDVSPMFLAKGRDKFRGYPSVTYRVLDIERDPAAQEFAAGSFDVVIAANVLHATADLRATLRHVRRLLAPGGLVLLLEGAKPLRLGDLIVGLTDGWWRFSDRDLRPAHALLAPARWIQVLAELGFEGATTLPSSGIDDGALAYHMVLVARATDQPDPAEPLPAPALRASGSWVVLSDGGPVGGRLGALLASRGARVVSVRPGARFAATGDAAFEVNPSNPDDFGALVREVRARDAAGCAGVVHLWSLDAAGGAESVEPGDAVRLGAGTTLYLLQALAREGAGSPALWLVTRGAQPAGAARQRVLAPGSALWGLARTIAREHPELFCGRLDLDTVPMLHEPELICRELLTRSHEDQIALRQDGRYVARLVPAPPTPADRPGAGGAPVQLFAAAPGTLEGIAFRPAPRQAPGAGEIEIAVDATGLNFRDVLRALGMYPDDSDDPLGIECAGRVAAVGPGVRDIAVGQRVMAIATGSFGTFATTRAALAAALPEGLSAAEGATIPSAFLTAEYALTSLARLRAGERVLIHAAAGGVGLAAVQVARRAGAAVFATAGSTAKRDFLRSLGVAHVFDSRSTSFAGEILAATNAEGVDVVLNSLSGEFIGASLDALRPEGRFVEIGRRGILTAEQFKAAKPDAAYFAVNLAEVCASAPDLAGTILRRLATDVADKTLRPLPLTSFGPDAVMDAFRYMAQARHIGKVVVSRDGARSGDADLAFAPDASYLITGGAAGLGLRIAEWMVEKGARRLMLLTRRAPSDAAVGVITRMEHRGAVVTVVRGDVSRADDVRAALALVPREAPLRGVMHCAGALDDGVLAQQDWNRFRTVLAPKVDGSWNLHALTRETPLDFFVLFSSAVSILGSPGQGNHAAACAYQDGLAWERAAAGLAACSVNWGPWAEIGSVVRQNVGDRLRTKGLKAFSPAEGLAALEAILRGAPPQVAVIQADWTAYVGAACGDRAAAPFFERLARPAAPRAAAAPARAPDFETRLREAKPAERRKALQAHVREQIATVLGLDARFPLEPQHGLRDLGIDSLMSIELRNRLQSSVGRPLPSTLAFDYPTVAALTEFLATRVLGLDAAEAGAAGAALGGRDLAAAAAEIGRLSPEEAEALLLEELSKADERRPV